jgi:erythromycin esterase-like protein
MMSTTLMERSAAAAARAVEQSAQPLTGAPADFDGLLSMVGQARYVLIGEASHGTHEFYRIRAEITKRLIREHGFSAVAVEADWPDAYRVNRFVRGRSHDSDATEALGDFARFPQWMWRNADVLDFVGWLRAHNDGEGGEQHHVGFYGLDLYSMHASMAAVLEYLDAVDPDAAGKARERYSCFDHFGEDPQEYGYAASYGLAPGCESEVVEQLIALRRSAAEYSLRQDHVAPDAQFFAEQNARLVRNAERYYRAMFGGRSLSWNLRDTHMAETLAALSGYLTGPGAPARIVVWAHNSHLGDARATESARRGELNLGQLVRARLDSSALLVGFSTYSGTVTAASDWGGDAERKRVRPALPESYEAVMHEVQVPRFFLSLRDDPMVRDALMTPRLERAIGVIYRPETERASHYFSAVLPQQFDALLHYDSTRAVEPLEKTGEWERGEFPETYPSGL